MKNGRAKSVISMSDDMVIVVIKMSRRLLTPNTSTVWDFFITIITIIFKNTVII